MTDLGIVIVNYNTRDLLRDCLASIYASWGDWSYKVYVVDNASVDGSAEMVRQEFPQAGLIVNDQNKGYAYANNLGLKALGWGNDEEAEPQQARTPTYALLLNPDTILPPRALSTMLEFISSHSEAGVVGPRLVLANGELDKACRRSFPSPAVSFYRMVGLSTLFPRHRRFGAYNVTYIDENQEAEVDSVVGAFMMLRSQAIADVGLLDEIFFMYGEDLDWCYRIKEAGWKVLYNPNCTVLHYKRASSRHSRKALYEFYRAMLLFYEKHYARTTPFWLHWFVVGAVHSQAGLAMFSDSVKRLFAGNDSRRDK